MVLIRGLMHHLCITATITLPEALYIRTHCNRRHHRARQHADIGFMKKQHFPEAGPGGSGETEGKLEGTPRSTATPIKTTMSMCAGAVHACAMPCDACNVLYSCLTSRALVWGLLVPPVHMTTATLSGDLCTTCTHCNRGRHRSRKQDRICS